MNKEELFSSTITTPYSKIINDLTIERIDMEYNLFGLFYLLNGIIGIAVPTDEIVKDLHVRRINPSLYTFHNILCSIGKLVFSLEKYNNSYIKTIKEAIWELYSFSLTIEEIEVPEPPKIYNFEKHDETLNHFRDILLKHVKTIHTLCIKEKKEHNHVTMVVFLCFSRSIFEIKQFQAPFRLTIEEAIKDSMGRDHLWKEYLEKWNVKKYTCTYK